MQHWLFSLRTFIGAMLALWIALRLGLDRPYWALASAYIVAQPLAGAMRSKAVYRLLGTLIGGVMTLVLLPNLVDAPELLVAALGLWVGVCVYFALLDRTPRAYVFLLAGYSVALIGLPSVDAPGAIWDVVVARVEEITLGIACSALVGSLLFPRPLGPALSARIDAWLRDAAAVTLAVLADHRSAARLPAARRRLGGDAVEIDLLASHLAYDISNLQSATRPLRLLQQRVVLLLPVISGIDDRLTPLRAAGAVTAELAAVMQRIAGWIGAAGAARPEEAASLHAAIAALVPRLDGAADWPTIIRSGVLVRLHELVDLVHDIMALRRQIDRGSAHLPELAVRLPEAGARLRHRDHAMALHSAFAAMVAIALLCAFWIGSAWPEGAGAAALAAVACAFFAAQDDPAPSIVAFLYATVIALVLDAVLLFAVLPLVDDFPLLVLALAPPFLLIGVLMSIPVTARAAGPVAFIAATELALSSSYSADFAAYLNGAIAAVVGLAATAAIIRVIRSVGAEWTAGRLLRANRADIARAAAGHATSQRGAFVTLMLDRLSLVVPRLAASVEGADSTSIRAMADVRVVVNVVDLQRDTGRLSGAARDAVDAMLRDLAAHYAQGGPPPAPLLVQIDAAIAAVTACTAIDITDPLLQLVGIRRGLFPAGPPYAPPLPEVQEAA